jgi:predicted O-methyltransferase YrrM
VSRLVAAANRLPAPARERLQRARWALDAIGFPRLRWWTKLRTLRAYGVGIGDPQALRYVLFDPELANFTYELANRDELAAFIAEAFEVAPEQVEGYFRETDEDPELGEGLRKRLARRRDRKSAPLFGRRLGWYAIARILKPGLIVETGIHDGLGSVLLLRALERNDADGRPGRLVSVDVNPQSGWLVDERLRARWTPIFGSTFDVLEAAVAGSEVGMIVHDSEHTYDCELFEFTTALTHAAPTLALVSDNAHATSALRDVCAEVGVEYRFFRERPSGHFYPGAGIGFGLVRSDGQARVRSRSSSRAAE